MFIVTVREGSDCNAFLQTKVPIASIVPKVFFPKMCVLKASIILCAAFVSQPTIPNTFVIMDSPAAISSAMTQCVDADSAFDAVYLNTPYKKLSIDELAALPVGDLAKPDSTLFMWTDTFSLAQATPLMAKWGFTYHSIVSVLNLAEEPPKAEPVRRTVSRKSTAAGSDEAAGEKEDVTAAPSENTDEAKEESTPPKKSKARSMRVKSVQPPEWWASDVEGTLSRPTVELLLMAHKGNGAPIADKFKPSPYQVCNMSELAKKNARARQPSEWCPNDWFFRRPTDFLTSVSSALQPDARIVELFGDDLHDHVHVFGPGVPTGYVPALASEEGIVATAKQALKGSGKTALRSLAAKLRRSATAAALPETEAKDGEEASEPHEMTEVEKETYARAAEIAGSTPIQVSGITWSAENPDLSLQRVMSCVADWKLANFPSRSKKNKRSPRSTVNEDGSPKKRYGIAAPSEVTPSLLEFFGEAPGTLLARTDVGKRLSQYIKENNLKDGKFINMDDKLSKLLNPPEGTRVTFFSMCRLVSPCFVKKSKSDPAKDIAEIANAGMTTDAETEGETDNDEPSAKAAKTA